MVKEPNDIPNAEKPVTGRRSPWLRRVDQTGVACLVALGLVGTVVWWWSHGGPRGQLIEFEHLTPQRARFQVDINQAEWPELAALPNVGETLARRIVETREQQGLFSSHNDLCRVRGIGPRKVEIIRPYLLPVSGYCETGSDAPRASGHNGA